jgi:hypothetical protein
MQHCVARHSSLSALLELQSIAEQFFARHAPVELVHTSWYCFFVNTTPTAIGTFFVLHFVMTVSAGHREALQPVPEITNAPSAPETTV